MHINQWYVFLDDAADAAVKIRRQLHRWPEIGGKEYRTAEIIEDVLKKLDLKVQRILPTGLVALLESGGKNSAKKTIAIRADMDGLPIIEKVKSPFSSERFGFMHACGHDVNMAVVLGTAMVLNEIKNLINIDVKYIFQPDEENQGGAKKMIEKGVLFSDNGDNQNTEVIFGVHAKPELPAGSIGIKYGKVHAASITFRIDVQGEKSHGAQPHMGTDAITAAAQMITAAQLIVSRELSPMRSGLITFGKIKGGDSRNTLADKVRLDGIIRGENIEICRKLRERLESITCNIAVALGTTVKQEYMEGYPALINHDGMVSHVREAVKAYNDFLEEQGLCETDSTIKIHEIQEHTMTVDDFAYYLEEIPGAYLFIGSSFPDKKTGGLHTSTFEVDERCIKTGIATMVSSILCV